MDCVKDILEDPVFQSMDNYFQHGNTTCKEHCIRVSYMSYRMCRRYGWDYRQAARALFSTIYFFMTGIPMRRRPANISMVSPIPERR